MEWHRIIAGIGLVMLVLYYPVLALLNRRVAHHAEEFAAFCKEHGEDCLWGLEVRLYMLHGIERCAHGKQLCKLCHPCTCSPVADTKTPLDSRGGGG